MTATCFDQVESLCEELERLNDLGSSAEVKRLAAVQRLRDLISSSACTGLWSAAAPPPSGARVLYLRGRALSAAGQSHAALAEAEECLARAVKLEPALASGWVALGELLMRRGDVGTAKLCFARAASAPSSAALRGLSMALRQAAQQRRLAPEETVALHEESVRCARDAVALGLADGASWYVLGNALVARAVAYGLAIDDLRPALRAYDRAEACGLASPDLHYNRGSALAYSGELERAACEFWAAHEQDPGWDAPQRECIRLASLADRIASLLARKRPRSAARVPKPTEPLECRSQAMLDVVGVATGQDEAPLVVVGDDGGGRRCVVCVYGVAPSAVKTGDVVSLAKLVVVSAQFAWRRPLPLAFPLIRTGHAQIEVNDKPVPAQLLAMPVAVLSTTC
jgi:tetratricopeptide (TPR) repeat protein